MKDIKKTKLFTFTNNIKLDTRDHSLQKLNISNKQTEKICGTFEKLLMCKETHYVVNKTQLKVSQLSFILSSPRKDKDKKFCLVR